MEKYKKVRNVIVVINNIDGSEKFFNTSKEVSDFLGLNAHRVTEILKNGGAYECYSIVKVTEQMLLENTYLKSKGFDVTRPISVADIRKYMGYPKDKAYKIIKAVRQDNADFYVKREGVFGNNLVSPKHLNKYFIDCGFSVVKDK